MTRDEFLNEMRDVLQTDAELTENTILADLEEWDSLSIMATMAFINKHFGVIIKFAEFRDFTTIGDIMSKVGI